MKSRGELDHLARVLGGLAIWGVFRDGPAARAGLRYGDIVLRVNGLATPTLDDYLSARRLRSDGAVVSYHRDGVTSEVELIFGQGRRLDLDDIIQEIVEGRMMPSAPPTSAPPSMC